MENRKENQEREESRISMLNEEEKKVEKKNKESNFMSKHLIKGLKRDLCVYDTNAD